MDLGFSTVNTVVLGLATFLAGWAGKNLLDWLLKPKLADWWARRNRRSALKRANVLLERMRLDILYSYDHRQIIINAEHRMTFLILWTGSMNTLVLILVMAILLAGDQLKDRREGAIAIVALLIPALFMPMIFSSRSEYRRQKALFLNFNDSRNVLLERLNRLLEAAGLNEAEKVAFLQTVPKPPITLDLKASL